jgi:hypothetical protein
MIRDLDNMLRALMRRIPELTSDDQISFRPPDQDWRTEVLNLQELALNLYLVDLRENRKLRSNESVRAGEVDGQVVFVAAPARVDCHYLITAWSPGQPGPAVEPTLDEHHLLYQAMAVLINNQPLNPARVYGEGNPILATLDDLFKRDLPSHVLPVEGFIKQPEFWGTMGTDHHWRPSIYLIVTVPLSLVLPPAGPPVTTAQGRVGRQTSGAPSGAADDVSVLAGRVFDATVAPQQPVAGAWVRLSDSTGREIGVATTDDAGRFAFSNVRAGAYRLEWRTQGKPVPPAREVYVPSYTGEYDLRFV